MGSMEVSALLSGRSHSAQRITRGLLSSDSSCPLFSFSPFTLFLSVFYRTDDSELASGLYGTSFPSAYMLPINTTTATAEMVLFFACLQGPPNCRYTLNYVTVTMNIST